jgi:hypothetical protein
MAKYTKEMEYNELAKRGECFCATSNCGGYGIVVLCKRKTETKYKQIKN